MTVEERNAFLTREYTEANRYIDNAKEALAKSKKDRYHYADKKYVRIACGTAYNGVLIALDAWLTVKGVQMPSKNRKKIEFYKESVGKLDKKMLTHLNSAYNILHLYGYYDGETSVDLVRGGFNAANVIIDKIKPAVKR